MKKYIFILSLYSCITLCQSKKIDYVFKKKNFEGISTLFIVGNESVFKIYDNRPYGMDKKNSTNDNMIFVNNDEWSTFFYTNDTTSITRIPLYKSEIIYNLKGDSKTSVDFTGKTKLISTYNCQEAKINMNGKVYNVWFTPDIDIEQGPLKINKVVPGLIVQLTEETNQIEINLLSIKKLENLDEFNKHKNYLLNKKVLNYKDYESKITEMLCLKKRTGLAKASELGAIITLKPDQSFYTQNLIDIPQNLIAELQKIKQ